MKRTLREILSGLPEGKAPSLIVLHGDDFRVHDATKKILNYLIPPEQRSLNIERFDGRTTPWEEVEAVLRIPPLFPGKKAVLIENAPYFPLP